MEKYASSLFHVGKLNSNLPYALLKVTQNTLPTLSGLSSTPTSPLCSSIIHLTIASSSPDPFTEPLFTRSNRSKSNCLSLSKTPSPRSVTVTFQVYLVGKFNKSCYLRTHLNKSWSIKRLCRLYTPLQNNPIVHFFE